MYVVIPSKSDRSSIEKEEHTMLKKISQNEAYNKSAHVYSIFTLQMTKHKFKRAPRILPKRKRYGLSRESSLPRFLLHVFFFVYIRILVLLLPYIFGAFAF